MTAKEVPRLTAKPRPSPTLRMACVKAAGRFVATNLLPIHSALACATATRHRTPPSPTRSPLATSAAPRATPTPRSLTVSLRGCPPRRLGTPVREPMPRVGPGRDAQRRLRRVPPGIGTSRRRDVLHVPRGLSHQRNDHARVLAVESRDHRGIGSGGCVMVRRAGKSA